MTTKIAHITTIDLSLRYLLANQMKALMRGNYDCTGISAPGPETCHLEAAGIRHLEVSMTRNVSPLRDMIALWRLYTILRREQFSIVHLHTPKAEFLGAVAARLAGVPIVVDTFRGIYYRCDMHPLWRKLFLSLARVTASCADLVLSQSHEMMEMAVTEGICPTHKIKYLGNGIDIQRFSRRKLSADTARKTRADLGIPTEAQVIGFVGRLVAEKGIPDMMRAIPLVLEKNPKAHFLFVGRADTAKPDALTPDIASEFGVAHSCTFAGFRQDMPALYSLMDVYVLPSHRESFPRSPMEASAMGVPCVVTNIPGCREVVEHNRNGLLFPMGDSVRLAEAISHILTNRQLASTMSSAGRQMAEEQFDETVIFDRIKNEYARLLREKGLPIPNVNLDEHG